MTIADHKRLVITKVLQKVCSPEIDVEDTSDFMVDYLYYHMKLAKSNDYLTRSLFISRMVSDVKNFTEFDLSLISILHPNQEMIKQLDNEWENVHKELNLEEGPVLLPGTTVNRYKCDPVYRSKVNINKLNDFISAFIEYRNASDAEVEDKTNAMLNAIEKLNSEEIAEIRFLLNSIEPRKR